MPNDSIPRTPKKKHPLSKAAWKRRNARYQAEWRARHVQQHQQLTTENAALRQQLERAGLDTAHVLRKSEGEEPGILRKTNGAEPSILRKTKPPGRSVLRKRAATPIEARDDQLTRLRQTLDRVFAEYRDMSRDLSPAELATIRDRYRRYVGEIDKDIRKRSK